MNHPKAVAEAAEKLAQAIQAARAAGYRVTFPDHVLVGVPVSETRRLEPTLEGEAPPVPVLGKASSKGG
jgi:hypothetical protein